MKTLVTWRPIAVSNKTQERRLRKTSPQAVKMSMEKREKKRKKRRRKMKLIQTTHYMASMKDLPSST